MKALTKGVTVDSGVNFGRPSIQGTGIRTEIIADRFRGGDSVAELADDYLLKPAQIEDALRWEVMSPGRKRRMLAKP